MNSIDTKTQLGAAAKPRWPAEWEPHECCWMVWPDSAGWGQRLEAVEREYVAVAHAIGRYEPVRMIANPRSAAKAKRMLGAGVDVVELPVSDSWFRDSGPTFVKQPDGGVSGLCWRFNGWGGAAPDFTDDARLARRLVSGLGLDAGTSAMAMEGGAIFSDGEGTLLTTDTVVFNPNRNPGLTREHAEAEFRRTLGVEKVIWLPGNDAEFGTNGHIDGIATFVRPGVVLFELSSEDSGPSFETTMKNLRALEGQTDAKGRKLDLLFIREGERLRAGNGDWGYSISYVNFYIANGGIVMPRFDLPGDDAARDAVAAAFPDHAITQVNIATIAAGGGGIHCITQQQPR